MQAAIPGADAVLVRYGDISMKTQRVRKQMEQTLIDNIRWSLADAGIPATIDHEWSRPIVVPNRQAAVTDAANATARTMGVVSASPCRRVEPTRGAILDAVREVAGAGVLSGRFAIRVRRSDKSLPFTSVELEHEAGDTVFEAVDDSTSLEVDLEEPTSTLHIEARESTAYLFTGRFEGPGGLPVGSQSSQVALISGGIDSPVAAYRTLRRGSPIVPLYIDLGPYSGPDHQARALEAIATLRPAMAETARETYLIPGDAFVTELVDRVERGRMLVLRRFMFRVADRIAETVDASGIVTGESIGQKSSQTAANLYATSVAVDRPIHRPLATLDKDEITAQAREIGTYRSSKIDAGCPSVAPNAVATQATPGSIDSLEWDGIGRLVEDAVERAEIIEPSVLETYRTMASTSG